MSSPYTYFHALNRVKELRAEIERLQLEARAQDKWIIVHAACGILLSGAIALQIVVAIPVYFLLVITLHKEIQLLEDRTAAFDRIAHELRIIKEYYKCL